MVLLFFKILALLTNMTESPPKISPPLSSHQHKNSLLKSFLLCALLIYSTEIFSIILCETGFLTSLQTALRALPP